MSCKVLITASTQSHIRHFHLSYLRWFRRQGWKVHVACAGVNAPLPEADQTIDLPLKKKMYALQNFQAAAILRKKICRERYDLIITHTALAAFFTRLAVKGMKNRPRVINVVHGYLFDHDTAGLKRMMLSAAEWLTKEQTDLLLTMNRWDQNYASQKKLGSTVMQIPGIGVDFSAFDRISRDAAAAVRRQLQIDEGKYMLLYAAEFSERKNQAALLRAMSHLPEQVVLVLPGSGAQLERCKQMAKNLGISHRVRFPGYISDMPQWYAAANAAVSASRSEGLPFNIMEAMYMELPVVASCVKGHEDLIVHGQNGLLYPYDDDVQFAAQVLRLLQEDGLAEKLGKQAKRAVLRYDLALVLPQVTSQYSVLFPENAKVPQMIG